MFSGDETAESHIEVDAELQELIHSHLALLVKDIPQALSIDPNAPTKFCDAYAVLLASELYYLDCPVLIDARALTRIHDA